MRITKIMSRHLFPTNTGTAALFLLAMIVLSCAERQRENPLDPSNPNTQGKITGLSVVSFDDRITLSWTPFLVDDYQGTRIFRKSSLVDTLSEIAFVGGNVSSFDDSGSGLNFEGQVTYNYRVQAITTDFGSLLSEEVAITPGPSRVWIGQTASPVLSRLTHDASHFILGNNEIFQVGGFALKKHKKGLWVSDLIRGVVLSVDDQGVVQKALNGLITPRAIEYDPNREFLWIWQQSASSVVFSDTSGEIIGVAQPFGSSVSIAVDTVTGFCWAADRYGSKLRVLSPEDLAYGTIDDDFNEPTDIQVYLTDGSLWVADVERVTRLFLQGFIEFYEAGFELAYRLAVDQNSGDCWVLDYRQGQNASRVVKISEAGQIILSVSGFTRPEAVAVDKLDGSCLIADSGNQRVVKLSSGGDIIGSWKAPGAPYLIRVSSP